MERKNRLVERRGRITGVVLAIALAALGPVPQAFAHAELVAAIPADGVTVEGTPDVVQLRFTEPLKANSSIELVGPAGSIISVSPSADDSLSMALVPPTLAPGLYAVRWTAATDDGHIERGSIAFTVVSPPPTPSPTPPPAPSASAAATATASAAPTPSVVPTPDPGTSGGSSLDPGTLLVLVGVAIVIGLATRRLVRPDRPR